MQYTAKILLKNQTNIYLLGLWICEHSKLLKVIFRSPTRKTIHSKGREISAKEMAQATEGEKIWSVSTTEIRRSWKETEIRHKNESESSIRH